MLPSKKSDTAVNRPADSEDDTEEIAAIPAINPFSRFTFTSSKSNPTCPRPQGKRKVAPEVDNSDDERKAKGRRISEIASGSENLGKIPGSPLPGKVKLYAHLKGIPDHLEEALDVVFCGINPGKQSAETGHHYGNPNNHFWGCLHESGLTSRKLDPREDFKLPAQFSIGLTNLVDRPTAQENELSKKEQIAAVPSLLGKIARYKPLVVCFVGLGIAEVVNASVLQRPDTSSNTPKQRIDKASVGLQSYKILHGTNLSGSNVLETLFFAVSSTSGRVVRYQKADKVQQFRDLFDLLHRIKEGGLDTRNLIAIKDNLEKTTEA